MRGLSLVPRSLANPLQPRSALRPLPFTLRSWVCYPIIPCMSRSLRFPPRSPRFARVVTRACGRLVCGGKGGKCLESILLPYILPTPYYRTRQNPMSQFGSCFASRPLTTPSSLPPSLPFPRSLQSPNPYPHPHLLICPPLVSSLLASRSPSAIFPSLPLFISPYFLLQFISNSQTTAVLRSRHIPIYCHPSLQFHQFIVLYFKRHLLTLFIKYPRLLSCSLLTSLHSGCLIVRVPRL